MFEQKASNKFPEVIVKEEVYRKINAYADLCDDEISAFGSVRVEGHKILIDDIFLFEQVVSGSSTVMSQKDISQFVYNCVSNGKDPSVLKFWYHSHAHMGVFWSPIDTDTINNLSMDWVVSMVSNKKHEFRIRLDMFFPFRMYMDNIPLIIEPDKVFTTAIKKEIDQKVKRYQIIADICDMIPGGRKDRMYTSDTPGITGLRDPVGNDEAALINKLSGNNDKHVPEYLVKHAAGDENGFIIDPDTIVPRREVNPDNFAPIKKKVDYLHVDENTPAGKLTDLIPEKLSIWDRIFGKKRV